jgi:hypothetical protein
MGVQHTLRPRGRSGCVEDQRVGIRIDWAERRKPRRVRLHQRSKVVRVRRQLAPIDEDDVIEGWQFRAIDGESFVRLATADEHARLAVVQCESHLAPCQPGIARHANQAGLETREVAEGRVDSIGQLERNAIARLEAQAEQTVRKRMRTALERLVGHVVAASNQRGSFRPCPCGIRE